MKPRYEYALLIVIILTITTALNFKSIQKHYFTRAKIPVKKETVHYPPIVRHVYPNSSSTTSGPDNVLIGYRQFVYR